MKKRILEYSAVFKKEKEGGYSVWIPDLPGCSSQGENIDEAMVNIKEAMALYLEDNPHEVKKNSSAREFTIPVQIYV